MFHRRSKGVVALLRSVARATATGATAFRAPVGSRPPVRREAAVVVRAAEGRRAGRAGVARGSAGWLLAGVAVPALGIVAALPLRGASLTAGGEAAVVAVVHYTAESEQQLAMSRLRAIEHGRTVVIAATSGISAVITPDGTVADRSELFTPWLWAGPIAQRQDTTVAGRMDALPEWTLAALGAGAVLHVVLRRRIGGGPSAPESDHPTQEGPR